MRRLLTAFVVLVAAVPAVAENWPQWRGPKNNGVSGETGLPAEWTEIKNVVWTIPLPGRSGATPCIWGDRIFLTSTVDGGSDLLALCLDKSGTEVWRKVVGKGQVNARKDEGDAASPSPVTDGKHVWVLFGTGDMACFDPDGKEAWRLNLEKRYGKLQFDFGMHSTPALHDGRLYLQMLHRKAQHVVCIDGATGDEVWKIDRPSDGKDECLNSYASPFVWSDGKDAYLVTHGNDYTVAHELKDGSERWRVAGLNPPDKYNKTLRFVASPVGTPDLIVSPSAKEKGVVAIKPGARGKIEEGSEYEQWRLPRGTPDVPCPLVVGDLVYLLGAGGSLTCLDAKTGKTVYDKTPRGGTYRASPVAADGKLYLTARDGVVTVVQGGPTYKVLASNQLPDTFTASPVVSGGRIYLRGFKNLYAIGMK